MNTISSKDERQAKQMTQGSVLHMLSIESSLSVQLYNEVITQQTLLNPFSLSNFLPESVLSKCHNYALRKVVPKIKKKKKNLCTFMWKPKTFYMLSLIRQETEVDMIIQLHWLGQMTVRACSVLQGKKLDNGELRAAPQRG